MICISCHTIKNSRVLSETKCCKNWAILKNRTIIDRMETGLKLRDKPI